jgi:type IV secretion system protein VirB6
MAKCAAIDAAAGSATTMVNTVDCYMQSTVQAGYANLLGPGSMFGYALTIALTIYVALVGYRLIFGRSSLSMNEMVPRMLLIGAVLALTSNWATYQVLVYDVLTDGPQEIVSAVNPSAGRGASVNERVDMLSGRMVDLADAWTEFDARPENVSPENPMPDEDTASDVKLPATANGITAIIAPKDSLGPNMLMLSALLLVLASAGTLVMAKIILGLLLLLGPIFAVLGLFSVTRGLTLGWARASVLMALVPVMAVMTAAGATALIEPVLTDMYVSANQGIFSLRSALTILVIVLITVAVSVQLFRIGRTIVSGWTISFRQDTRAQSQPAIASSPAEANSPSSFVYNERLQSMVGAIERSAVATSSTGSANQRAILLPHRFEAETTTNRKDDMKTDRRISKGRVTAVRAPIKSVRNAA